MKYAEKTLLITIVCLCAIGWGCITATPRADVIAKLTTWGIPIEASFEVYLTQALNVLVVRTENGSEDSWAIRISPSQKAELWMRWEKAFSFTPKQRDEKIMDGGKARIKLLQNGKLVSTDVVYYLSSGAATDTPINQLISTLNSLLPTEANIY